MLITFTHKEIIGDKYIHVFKMDDDSINEVETSQEDYEQLATPEHIDPTIEGGEWITSHSKRKLDTESGDLSNGECFDDGDGCTVKYNDSLINLSQGDMVDGQVEESVLEEKTINI